MGNIKKLQRDTQHKVIGGVCSGLANYFGIDAVLMRLLFVIAFLVFSTGFWIYLIMWIVMPSGSTTPNQAKYYAAPNGDVVDAEVVDDGAQQVEKQEDKKEPDTNKGGLVVGLILIGIGALGLLHKFVPEFNWSTAWPVLLIILGIFLLLPSKTKES